MVGIEIAGLAIVAVLIGRLLGRRKTLIVLASAACVGIVAAGGVLARRAYLRLQPPGALQLTLQLARRQWHVGENPWYLLQMKNIGGGPVKLFDDFWWVQARLRENMSAWGNRDTYFEIIDPDGRRMKPNFWLEWGYHGEFRFWENECGKELCDTRTTGWVAYMAEIKPGETLTATPSVAAPLRKRNGRAGVVDARIRPDSTSEDIAAIKELWKSQEGYYREFAGGKPYRFDPQKPPGAISGFRILEGYFFRKPGVYRMRAIYDTRPWFTPASETEDISQFREKNRREPAASELEVISHKWRNMKPDDLAKLRQDRQKDIDSYNSHKGEPWVRGLVESNEVELEFVQ